MQQDIDGTGKMPVPADVDETFTAFFSEKFTYASHAHRRLPDRARDARWIQHVRHKRRDFSSEGEAAALATRHQRQFDESDRRAHARSEAPGRRNPQSPARCSGQPAFLIEAAPRLLHRGRARLWYMTH